jgi:cytolysin-activating lysine-acyltransferase
LAKSASEKSKVKAVTTAPKANGANGRQKPPAGNVSAAKSDGQRAPAPLGAVRQTIQLRMGQLVLACARLPRYRDVPLKALMASLLEPLQRDRVAFAEKNGELVGMALWASVSDAVSDKITRQIGDKVFPLDLAANDWNSGENVWLLDVIVPNRKAGTAVFMNFAQLIGERSFRLHPVVAQSVDPELVEKMNAMLKGDAQESTKKPAKAKAKI